MNQSAADPENDMTEVKLHILCYYAQAWHLVFTDEPLFDDTIVARASGPWIPSLDGPVRITKEGRRADAPVMTMGFGTDD
jgi:uncharacterized phage-associated protein